MTKKTTKEKQEASVFRQDGCGMLASIADHIPEGVVAEGYPELHSGRLWTG